MWRIKASSKWGKVEKQEVSVSHEQWQALGGKKYMLLHVDGVLKINTVIEKNTCYRCRSEKQSCDTQIPRQKSFSSVWQIERTKRCNRYDFSLTKILLLSRKNKCRKGTELLKENKYTGESSSLLQSTSCLLSCHAHPLSYTIKMSEGTSHSFWVPCPSKVFILEPKSSRDGHFGQWWICGSPSPLYS